MSGFRWVVFIGLLFFCVVLKSQTNGSVFTFPIDRAIVVTGNYGELRPNHFHAGLDFSTDPISNLPVKAVKEGYISRIKISSGGYGKALYITHPNGYVTVYAHQKRFATKINDYVKQKQIAERKNEIELFPAANELPVTAGEVIGYTGNTGSSTGPHLHFEIREEKSEIPLNPLLMYDVKDNVKPVVTHLAFYNTTDTNNVTQSLTRVLNTKTKKSILTNTILLDHNHVAVAYAGYDQANASSNKNNIYEAVLSLDGSLIYHHQLNYISFDQARYVNYFCDKINGVKYQKCFTPQCYDAGLYKAVKNGGRMVLQDTLMHQLELILRDEKGNADTNVFYIKAKKLQDYKETKGPYNAYCNKDCVVEKDDIKFSIKAGSLVRSTFVAAYRNKQGKAVVGQKGELLLKSYSLSFKVPDALTRRGDKMVALNEDNCVTGKYDNGWFSCDTKLFGTFSISYDTIAPHIKCSIPLKKQANLSAYKAISFKANDQMSGITDYHIYINNIWQIAEYDAKSDTITCYFDEQTPKGDVVIKLEVIDRVGNKAVFELKTKR